MNYIIPCSCHVFRLTLALILFIIIPVTVMAQATTQLVSVSSSGTQGNAGSGDDYISLSADGRFVVFESDASNLVPDDTNYNSDLFVRDMVGGITKTVARYPNGRPAYLGGKNPSISGDGRYIAFCSLESLVDEDANNNWDVFVRDMVEGVTTLVSVATDGTQGTGYSEYPSISADGRVVAFESISTNLVPGDTNGKTDVFVRDLVAGTTKRVSVTTSGVEANSYSYNPSISADGRYVVFYSPASNLVAGDTNGSSDVFVRDTTAGTTTRVSVATSGAQGDSSSFSSSISADGRYVVFTSSASNLVPDDTNGKKDVFVRDRVAGTTKRVSVASNGVEGNLDSYYPSICANGRYVAFKSSASNLVPSDINGDWDVFVRDTLGGATYLVSVATDRTQGANTGSKYDVDREIVLSADGRYVAFRSYATNLVPGDTNKAWDVFLRGPLFGSAPLANPIVYTTSTPNTILADGSSTSTIMLTYRHVNGEPAIGRTIRFSSSRGAADVFSSATAVTDGNGAASVTVRSSTIGRAVITCRDETTNTTLSTSTTVRFVDPATPVFVEPWFRRAYAGDRISDTYDGNAVQVVAKVTNRSSSMRNMTVRFCDGASLSDPPLYGAPNDTLTKYVPAYGTAEVVWNWDTRGYAWGDNHDPHPYRVVRVGLYENGNLVDAPDPIPITVMPRPVILVHGFLSDAGTWDQYVGKSGFLKTTHSLWNGYAVTDLNMGHLWPPTPITNTISQNAAILSSYINKVMAATRAEHVDIVAHSMGGLVSREYIQNLMPDSRDGSLRPVVSHLVMLGTPNLGAGLSDAADVLDDYFPMISMLGQPARHELTVGHVSETFNRNVNNGRNVSWWGFRGKYHVPILGLGDGVVGIESARFTIHDNHINLLDHRPVFHMGMTRDWATFRDYVRVDLSPGPGTNWDAEPRPVPLRFDGPRYEDQSSDIQAIFSKVVPLPGYTTTSTIIDVPVCTQALFTVTADESVASTIRDPSGSPVSVVAAQSEEAKEIFRHFAVDNPTQGNWTVQMYRPGEAEMVAGVSCIVRGAALMLTASGYADPDRRIVLTADFRNGVLPVTGALVTAYVNAIRGGTTSLLLIDDGIHNDGAANDGVYGGTTAVLEPDSYGIEIVATAGGAKRYAGTTVEVRRPPFSFPEAGQAARIGAGFQSATAHDAVWLDATQIGGNGVINFADAVRIARKVAGLEPNP